MNGRKNQKPFALVDTGKSPELPVAEGYNKWLRQSRPFIEPGEFCGRVLEQAQRFIVENHNFNIGLRYVVRVISVVGPLTGLPQVLSVWINMNSAGISLLSWSLFLAISFLWLLHALSQKDRALIISNSLWILIDAAIISGALVSRIFKG